MNQGIEKGYLSLGICDYGECLHAACCMYWVPSLVFSLIARQLKNCFD